MSAGRKLRVLLFAFLTVGAVLGVMLGLAALRGYHLVRVASDEMSPSIRPGDWLLLGPGTPTRGDVVRLRDPLDSGRRVWRRVLAEPGESIGFTGHQPRLDGQAVKQVVMGDVGQELVLMENSAWLLAVSLAPTRFQMDPVQVPPGELFLVADHRDHAIDSRWWGSLPADGLEKVHLRIGPSDLWRPSIFRPRQTVRPEIPMLPYQVPEELKQTPPSGLSRWAGG
jgi:signal peptidase I